MAFKVHCAHKKMVPISEIKLNPKNRNKHPQEQIENLAEGLEFFGWRHPLIVRESDMVCQAGEGRFLAAKFAGETEVPVDFQEFVSPELAQQFSVYDNEIARWATPDFSGINEDMADWGPEFDPKFTGIRNFEIEPADRIRDIKEPDLDDTGGLIIAIECETEAQMAELFEELKDRGLNCKLIT